MKKSTITNPEPLIASEEVVAQAISKLHIQFGNEDLNKLVEKINEIIEKQCQ